MDIDHLSAVSQTLIIPVWARAMESRHAQPLFEDRLAEELMNRLKPDTSDFQNAKLSQVGTACRTVIFDEEVTDFIEKHPQSIVINLGAGLDTRAFRLSRLPFAAWYEIDLPEVMALRESLLANADPRVHTIAADVLKPEWCEQIVKEADQAVLMIAEGLSMYFSEAQVQAWLSLLASRFPGALMLLEVLCPLMARNQRLHDAVKNGARFQWTVRHSRDIESYDSRLRWVGDRLLIEKAPARWGIYYFFARLPWLGTWLNQRIVKIRFQQ